MMLVKQPGQLLVCLDSARVKLSCQAIIWISVHAYRIVIGFLQIQLQLYNIYF